MNWFHFYTYLDHSNSRIPVDIIGGRSIRSKDVGARCLELAFRVVPCHSLIVQQLLCDIQADRLGEILQSAQKASFGVKGRTKVRVLECERFSSFGGGHNALWFLNIN